MSFSSLRSSFKGLPKEIWFLYVTTMISRLGGMAMTYLAVYLTDHFDISKARAGFAVTVYGMGALLSSWVTGYLSDRFSSLTIMRSGLLLQGLVLLIFPFAPGYYSVLALAFVWALTGESYKPASGAFISRLPDKGQRRRAFALNRSAINVGMCVGPALGGILYQAKSATPPVLLFFVNSAASIIAGIFLAASMWKVNFQWPTPSTAERPALPADAPEVPGNRGLSFLLAGLRNRLAAVAMPLRDRRLLFLLLAMLPALVVFFQYRVALPQHLTKDHHLPTGLYGLLFTINTLLVVFLEVPLNSWLQKTWSDKFSMSLGALLIGAGFGSFAFSATFPTAAACFVVWTAGEMMLFSSSSDYVSKIAGEHHGKYQGLYYTAINLASCVGPWLGAVLLTHGAWLCWGTMFLFGCLSATILLALKLPEQGQQDVLAVPAS
jgi:predicted MFS family arabinose efflux permease